MTTFLKIDLRLGSRKSLLDGKPPLVVFTTQEKALAYGHHVEEQGEGPWRMFADSVDTSADTRGDLQRKLYGMCTVDPSPEGFGTTLGVNGLHLV